MVCSKCSGLFLMVWAEMLKHAPCPTTAPWQPMHVCWEKVCWQIKNLLSFRGNQIPSEYLVVISNREHIIRRCPSNTRYQFRVFCFFYIASFEPHFTFNLRTVLINQQGMQGKAKIYEDDIENQYSWKSFNFLTTNSIVFRDIAEQMHWLCLDLISNEV